ncbi:MAG: response regulator [Lachnospiraceae bacterium]|nr:response regulator [Lachnospiraceae bacterium]
MLKVLLVDDEPFILQGLKVLLNWDALGCEIISTASNGLEAYEYIKNNQVDLVITDIKMPEMNGLEFLKNIRENGYSDLEVIILSGYKDFEYAMEGMKYGCAGYVLKPVEGEELTSLIKKIAKKKNELLEESKQMESMERAFMARNIIAMLFGKYDEINVSYIKEQMQLSDEIRFASIEFINPGDMDEEEEAEIRQTHRDLYELCRSLLGKDANHVVFDTSSDQNSHEIGLILCDYMYKEKKASEEEFLMYLRDEIYARFRLPIRILAGKKVNGITNLSKSYSTVRILKSFEGFRPKKDIYFYEDEAQVNQGGGVLCKQYIDDLIRAVELNDHKDISFRVSELFKEMRRLGIASETIKLNMDYLLFGLIHLAANQDDGVNQEEVLQYISESSFHEGVLRGSSEHLSSFAIEYAEYLSQLRKNVSGSILDDIENEVKKNYMNNISLRELSKKLYINSSYLGQIFKKKYNMSFKDYLTVYRINEASLLLVETDEKITKIAEMVGYKDSDYFVRKFIEIKGCTPSKYRKNKND